MFYIIRQRLTQFEKHRFIPIVVITACIQGALIASQFLAAFFLTPSEIGVIRSLESTLSVMILIGSCGAQALSIRDVAASRGMQRQLQILRDIYIIVLMGAFVMIAALAIGHQFLRKSILFDTLLIVSGMILITNVLRATSGFTQGAGITGKTYLFLLGLTISAVCVQLFVTAHWGVAGWIAGRYLSEGLVLVGMWLLLRRIVGPVPWHMPIEWGRIILLLRNGTEVNFALIVRLVADNLPILILVVLKIPTDQIGFFGLAMLVITMASLPMAIVAQRTLPIIVTNDLKPGVAEKITDDLTRLILILALATSGIITVVALLLYWTVGGPYESAYLLTAMLCWILPFRGLALSYGTFLMARRHYRISIGLNISEAFIVTILGFIAIGQWEGIGATAVVILCSLWSAITYRLAAIHNFSSPVNRSNSS